MATYVISVDVQDKARPDEVQFALRKAAELARERLDEGLLEVDESYDLRHLPGMVACAIGGTFYRSE